MNLHRRAVLRGRPSLPSTRTNLVNAIAARVASLETPMLKEMAEKLSKDFLAEADTVLNAVIDELMKRLPEAEFCAFVDAL